MRPLSALRHRHNLSITFIPQHTPKQNNRTPLSLFAPLSLSVRENRVEIVRVLLNAGAEQLDPETVSGDIVGLELGQVQCENRIDCVNPIRVYTRHLV